MLYDRICFLNLRLVTKPGRGRSDMAIAANAFHKLAIQVQLSRGVSLHALDSTEEVARLARCATKAVAEFDYRSSLRSSEAIFGCAGINAPNIRISDKVSKKRLIIYVQAMQSSTILSSLGIFQTIVRKRIAREITERALSRWILQKLVV